MKKILIILLFLFILQSCDDEGYVDDDFDDEYNESYQGVILVDLKGEVIRPGIYSVKKGSTLYDVVCLAGGFTSLANTSSIALTEELTSNCMKTIPSTSDPITDNTTKLININTAGINELTTLSGIGTSIAQRIIDYRNNNGKFKKIEDIKKVSGIGDALFNKIKDKITV